MSTHPQINRGQIRAALLPDLLVSIIGPVLVYRLAAPHMPATDALLLAGVLPLLRIGSGLIRRHRLNLIGGLSLLAVILKILLGLLLKDARLVLASDSLITAVYGILLLTSLLTSSPLLLRLFESVLDNMPSTQHQMFLQRWSQPEGCAKLASITAIWGISLLLECAVQILLAFTLPVAQDVLISPTVRYSVWAMLLLWTFLFTRGRRTPGFQTSGTVSGEPMDESPSARS